MPVTMKRIACAMILALVAVGIYSSSAFASSTVGYFEVCKLADNSNGPVSGSFTFTWSGGSATVPTGSCSTLQSAPVGSLTITETARAGFGVSAISSDPAGRIISSSTSDRAATVSIVAGNESTQSVVIFTNRVVPTLPPPTGYLEVCKDSTNGVTGNFSFSVNGGAPFNVAAGSCSSSIQVSPGTATITEADRTGFALDHVYTEPAARFVGLTGSTASVQIVAGDVSTQTIAHFVNKPVNGEFKICKAADNSNGTVDGSWTFNLSPASGDLSTVIVPVGSCSLPISYQQGTSVTVSEVLQTGVIVKSIALVPGTSPSTTLTSHNEATGTAVLSIGSGISDLTFTNMKPPTLPPPPVFGEIKVCKAADNTNGTVDGSFTFALSPAAGLTSSVTVPVGSCSLPLQYLQGTSVTVSEVLQSGIVVQSIVLVPGVAPATTLTAHDEAAGTATVSIGSGISDLTFTNARPPTLPPPPPTIIVCELTKGYFMTHSSAVTSVTDGSFSLSRTDALAILALRGTAGSDGTNLVNLYQQALASYYNVQAALHAGADASDPLLASVIASYTQAFAGLSFDGTTITTTLSASDQASLLVILADFSQDVCRTFLQATVS